MCKNAANASKGTPVLKHTIRSFRFTASFQEIRHLSSAFMTLQLFGLAHTRNGEQQE